MYKSALIGFATSALVAPIALLLVAIPSTPAVATKAPEAAASCKAMKSCVGTWTEGGGWVGFVGTAEDPVTVTCPPKRDCVWEMSRGRRGTKVLGILKRPTAGLKPPSAGQAGPKKFGAPTAGVKLPKAGFNPPANKPSSGSSGQRR